MITGEWERDRARKAYNPINQMDQIRACSKPFFPRLSTEADEKFALSLLEAYSRRELSNESDVLLAIFGIFHNVGTMERGSDHCWGLLVLNSTALNMQITSMWPTWRQACFEED